MEGAFPGFLAEEDAEEVRELAGVAAGAELIADVAGATESAERASAGRAGGASPADLLPVGPELVVLAPLVRIAEDLVGLVHLLEATLGGLVTGLGVRMVLAGELSVGLLDLGRRRRPGHAQDGVVILVFEARCAARHMPLSVGARASDPCVTRCARSLPHPEVRLLPCSRAPSARPPVHRPAP